VLEDAQEHGTRRLSEKAGSQPLTKENFLTVTALKSRAKCTLSGRFAITGEAGIAGTAEARCKRAFLRYFLGVQKVANPTATAVKNSTPKA
jgi:hypothetical protein